jgi:hypothetical protein
MRDAALLSTVTSPLSQFGNSAHPQINRASVYGTLRAVATSSLLAKFACCSPHHGDTQEKTFWGKMLPDFSGPYSASVCACGWAGGPEFGAVLAYLSGPVGARPTHQPLAGF